MANIRAFRKFVEGINTPETINAFPIIIQLKQQNTFVYSTVKPRREPKPNSYFRNSFATFSSRASTEAYILQKVQELWKKGQKSFCFKDFPEIKYESFKQLIFRLRKAEKVIPKEPRTNPRFYALMDPPSPDEFENF
ncbi:MAG: hypothetical protein ACFFCW_41995 [Candidatus Hodarchaeota archaeon]